MVRCVFGRNKSRSFVICSSLVVNVFGELRSSIFKVSVVSSYSWACSHILDIFFSVSGIKCPGINEVGKKGFILTFF